MLIALLLSFWILAALVTLLLCAASARVGRRHASSTTDAPSARNGA
jgi:hypothetical protein